MNKRFDLQQSGQLAELSIKLANASEQDSAATSDQITALMNAYGLSNNMEELSKALDSWALVANVSAADVEELAKASQKAASTAATTGVSLEQLNAQIATIESVTKEAPEQIGNGLKTLYARFSDLEMGATLEDGVDLGKVTSTLQGIGVEVLDAEGKMRGVGDIIEDMMEVWSDLDQTHKAAVAQTVAGKYQLGRFEALMNAPEMYDKYTKASMNAEGTMDQMNEEFINSLEGRMNVLQATWEDLFNSLFDTDSIYPFIDLATKAIDLIDTAVDSIGGGIPLLTGLVSVFGKLFSTNLSQNISNFIGNKRLDEIRASNAENVEATAARLGLWDLGDENQKNLVDFVIDTSKFAGSLSTEQMEEYNKLIERQVEALNQDALAQEELQKRIKKTNDALEELDINVKLEEGYDNITGNLNNEYNVTKALEDAPSVLDVRFEALKESAEAGQKELEAKIEKELAEKLEAADITIQEIEDEFERELANKIQEIESETSPELRSTENLRNQVDSLDRIISDISVAKKKSSAENILADSSLQQNFESFFNNPQQIEGASEEQIKNITSAYEDFLEKVTSSPKLSNSEITRFLDILKQRVLEVKKTTEKTISEVNSDNRKLTNKAGEESNKRIKAVKAEVNKTKTARKQEMEALKKEYKEEAKKEIEEQEKATKERIKIAEEEVRRKKELIKETEEGIKETKTMTPNIDNIDQNIKIGEEEQKAFFEDVKDQDVTKSMINVISSIGELAFAWQSFQSLGSIWKNEDLNTGEKIFQIITNLAFTLPTVLNSLKGLKEDFGKVFSSIDTKALDAVKENLQEIITKGEKSQETLTYASDEIRKGLEKDIAAGKVAEEQMAALGPTFWKSALQGKVGTDLLKAGFITLGTTIKTALIELAPLLVISAVIGAISSAIGAMQEEERQRVEKISEDAEKARQNLDNIAKSDFFKKWDAYKENKEITEDLKTSMAELANQVGLNIDAEAIYEGNIEKVNEAIKERIRLQKEESVASLKKQNEEFESQYGPKVYNLPVISTSSGIQTPVNMPQSEEKWDLAEDIKQYDDLSVELSQAKQEFGENSKEAKKLQKEVDALKEKLKDIDIEQYKKNFKDIFEVAKDEFINGREEDQISKEEWEEFLNGEAAINYSKTLSEEIWQAQIEGLTKGAIGVEDAIQLSPMEEKIEDIRNRFSDVWQAFKEDATVGAEQLSDVFNQDIVDAFDAAKEQSDAFGDSLTLLTDNTFKTQKSMVDLKSTLDDIDHSMQLDNLDEQEKKLEEVEAHLEHLHDSSTWTPIEYLKIDTSDIKKAEKEVQKLADQLEDKSFNLSIDIGGDLIDQANMITEALGDIEDGIGKIGEDFLVAAEDAASLEQAFPGILENYSITADGMIQLDQQIAQGAIDTATADAESSVQAQATKLKSYADYAEAMSEYYMTQAVEFAKMAQSETLTNDEANEAIAKADKRLEDFSESQLQEKDAAVKTAAENESKYNDSAAQNLANSMAQGAASAEESMSDLSDSSAAIVRNLINQWHEVAKAVAAAGRGEEDGDASSIQGEHPSNVSQEGWNIQSEPIAAGETIIINGNEYVVNESEGAGIAAAAAEEYEAKADALARAASQARAAAASMEATAARAGDAISNVGMPEDDDSGDSGSDKGSEYTPKTKDPIEEEIDLYEKVNTQLNDVHEVLENIRQETDRLIGPAGRANMNRQLDLLQKEINLQKEKLAIQEQERANIQSELKWFGAEFDSEGFLDNYATILKDLEGEVNDLIEQYNNETTEEGQDRLEQEIENAQHNLDLFKQLYQRYDELQGQEIQDTINQIEELKDAIEDLRIEAYKASQQAIDDIKELKDKSAELLGLWTKYDSKSPLRAAIVDAEKLRVIFGGTKAEAEAFYQTLIDKNKELAAAETDTKKKNAYLAQAAFFEEQIENLDNNPSGTYGTLGLASADLARLQRWIDNPNASDNIFGENTAALYEAYEDAYNRLADLALEAEQVWESLQEDIINRYDQIAEDEEEQIDRYDRLTKRLETIADMQALAYGDAQYANMKRIYDQIAESTHQQMLDQRVILQNWIDRYNAIENKNSDYAKEVRKHMEEAEDKLIEIQNNVLKAWQEAFKNFLKEIAAQTNKNIFGFRNLDDVSSDWERDKDYNQKYYDNVQKTARIEQLRLKYLDLLDDAQTSSLAIQNKIKDAMQDQISYLEEQEHLSEYNVKYANAQLEILQKQIALEDARNNKNQMRLRRDTQGNYRYVYTANQDDVRDKEADLLQSQMDAYDMSKANRLDNVQNVFDYYRTTMDQLQALEERIQQGDEDAIAAKEALLEDFKRDMAAYSEEIGDSWEGMIESLEWMVETGSDSVKDAVSDTLEAMLEGNMDFLMETGQLAQNIIIEQIVRDNIPELLDAVMDANSQMTKAAYDYKELIDTQVAPVVENSFSNIDGAIQNASISTRDLAEASRELNDALMGDNSQLTAMMQQLEDYRDQLEATKNSSSETARQLQEARDALNQAKAENLNYKTELDEWRSGQRTSNSGVSNAGSSNSNSGSSSGNKRVGSIVGFRGQYYYDSYGTSPAGSWHANEPNAVRIAEWSSKNLGGTQNTGPYEASLVALDGTWLGWVKTSQLFDSGGYTGKWSDSGVKEAKDGKLAFLHQKELVLNESDTENVLKAVDMVRNMTDMLKLFSNISSINNSGFNKLGGDTIEQRVEITAEFPNVQSSNEIEKALLNIADSAYQYSYKIR